MNLSKEQIQKHELNMILEIDRVARKYNYRYFLAYGSVLGAVRHSGFIPWDTDIDIIVSIDDYNEFCHILRKEISKEFKIDHINFDSSYDSLKARMALKEESNLLIHIDIFPMVGLPDNIILQRLFIFISRLNYRLYYVKKLNANINFRENWKRRYIAKLIKILIYPIPARLFIYVFRKLKKLYPIEQAEYIYNICGLYRKKEIIPKKWINKPVYVEFEGIKLPIPADYHKYLTHIYGDYMTPKKTNFI